MISSFLSLTKINEPFPDPSTIHYPDPPTVGQFRRKRKKLGGQGKGVFRCPVFRSVKGNLFTQSLDNVARISTAPRVDYRMNIISGPPGGNPRSFLRVVGISYFRRRRASKDESKYKKRWKKLDIGMHGRSPP